MTYDTTYSFTGKDVPDERKNTEEDVSTSYSYIRPGNVDKVYDKPLTEQKPQEMGRIKIKKKLVCRDREDLSWLRNLREE